MFYIRIIVAVIQQCRQWPRLIANRILTKLGLSTIAPRIDTIYLKNGMRFSTGPTHTLGGSDLFLVYELWDKESYYIPEVPEFKINEHDIVFDVGANRGYFSCYAAKKASHGKVYSFEPVPVNFNVLKENLLLNKITNVTAENVAVSSSKKNVELYLDPGDEAANSIYHTSGEKITVPATDLWSYSQEKNVTKIDFLKVDCEGEEYAIFESLPDAFWLMVGKISMEYHSIDKRDPKDLVRILESKNFEVLVFDEKYIKAVKRA